MIIKIKNYPNITTDAQHYGDFERMQGVYEVESDNVSYARTTADIRLRYRFAKIIHRITSYIRKRCVTF